jgi:hypothetical protein
VDIRKVEDVFIYRSVRSSGLFELFVEVEVALLCEVPMLNSVEDADADNDASVPGGHKP